MKDGWIIGLAFMLCSILIWFIVLGKRSKLLTIKQEQCYRLVMILTMGIGIGLIFISIPNPELVLRIAGSFIIILTLVYVCLHFRYWLKSTEETWVGRQNQENNYKIMKVVSEEVIKIPKEEFEGIGISLLPELGRKRYYLVTEQALYPKILAKEGRESGYYCYSGLIPLRVASIYRVNISHIHKADFAEYYVKYGKKKYLDITTNDEMQIVPAKDSEIAYLAKALDEESEIE